VDEAQIVLWVARVHAFGVRLFGDDDRTQPMLEHVVEGLRKVEAGSGVTNLATSPLLTFGV